MWVRQLRYYIRYFLRNRAQTLFNVGGLAIGLAISLIVLLYVENELSYDRHFPDYDRIYRVAPHFQLEQNYLIALSGMGLGPLMKKEYDEIEEFTRIGSVGENVFLKHGGNTHYEDLIYFTDSNFFSVFETRFLEGDSKQCFRHSNNMVVTQSFARELFGNKPPLGKVVQTSNNTFTISGVIADPPQNSHLVYRALLPAFLDSTADEELRGSLWMSTLFTYVRLKEGTHPDQIESRFTGFYNKYMREMGEALGGSFSVELERLDKVHLYSNADFDLNRGNITYLWAFGGIGALILILAMINYINMATARAPSRAGESGIRKVLGSDRKSLIFQLLGESVLTAFIGLFLAVSLAEITVNTELFKEVAQKDLSEAFFRSRFVWLVAPLVALSTGILAGIYPAYQISGYSEIESIKKGEIQRKVRPWIRTVLVSFQITMSITVVVLSLTMARQMEFIQTKNLGYNKSDVLLIPIQDSIILNQYDAIKSEFLRHPHVKDVSMSSTVPGWGVGRSLVSFDPEGLNTEVVEFMVVGFDYFRTMQIPIIEGRPFDPLKDSADDNVVIVNQQWMERMGWDHFEDHYLYWAMDENGSPTQQGRVIGVSGNFNSFSIHEEIGPLVFYLDNRTGGSIHVRIDPEHHEEVIGFFTSGWEQFDARRPFEYSFIAEDLGKLYTEDDRLAKLTSALSVLVIFMSCLGLLGLASFIIQRKTREIGIRKILGASESAIFILLVREISVLLLVSSLIAIPLSWKLSDFWLQSFAFVSQPGIGIFVGTIISAFLLALITVAYHMIQASLTNPVDVLKYE